MTTATLYRFSPLKSIKAVGHGIYRMEGAVARHRSMLADRSRQIVFQLVMLGALAVSYVLVGLINDWWPNFFEYSYVGEIPSWDILQRFWPLGLWCLTLIIVLDNDLKSSHLNGKLWVTGMITGNLAGIWVEIGYRYLYICFAMLWLVFFNWILGTALMWVLVAFLGLATLGILFDDKHSPIVAIFPFMGVIFFLWISSFADPLFWLYESITMPVINFLAFDSFEIIFTDTEQYPALLVMGGIMANLWFRDGHKYQGWFGYLDSWMVGFVLLYAMFTYGLLTAIVLHCMWNSAIYTSRLLKRTIIR